VLSGDDDAPKIDASIANLQAPDGDDAEGDEASSVETIAPGPIGSNTPVQTDPTTSDRGALGAPSASGHKRKHPLTIPKHRQIKTSTVQVMTQIELPPYRGPKSPLDLVAIEMIFWCLFEVFQRTSQAVGARSSVGGDTQPLNKKRSLMLKSILTPR
jgi:hypothetical protein